MIITKDIFLYLLTALAEIVGCYLPYLWLKQGKSSLLLIPAGLCLALFAYLLTLHPDAAGRTYAAYGGVYVLAAIIWLWAVEGQQPNLRDCLGALLIIVGTFVILSQKIKSL